MKRIVYLAVIICLATSCKKDVYVSDISGSWRSLREEWTIIDNGKSSKEVFDYGGAPEEESADFRIYYSSFIMFSGSAGSEASLKKSFNLEYSDRFSAVDEETKERVVSMMSAKLKRDKITGSTGETWVIRDVDGDVMSLDYDSGKKEGEVWRRCRFVFVKVGDVVVR